MSSFFPSERWKKAAEKLFLPLYCFALKTVEVPRSIQSAMSRGEASIEKQLITVLTIRIVSQYIFNYRLVIYDFPLFFRAIFNWETFLLPLRCSLHRGDLLLFITLRWKKSLIASNLEFNSSSGSPKTRLALSFGLALQQQTREWSKKKRNFPRKDGKKCDYNLLRIFMFLFVSFFILFLLFIFDCVGPKRFLNTWKCFH